MTLLGPPAIIIVSTTNQWLPTTGPLLQPLDIPPKSPVETSTVTIKINTNPIMYSMSFISPLQAGQELDISQIVCPIL